MADKDEWLKKSKENVNVEEDVKEEVDEGWFMELTKISGVGEETAKDIGRVFSDIEALKAGLARDEIPLRNDIVEKLKEHFSN